MEWTWNYWKKAWIDLLRTEDNCVLFYNSLNIIKLLIVNISASYNIYIESILLLFIYWLLIIRWIIQGASNSFLTSHFFFFFLRVLRISKWNLAALSYVSLPEQNFFIFILPFLTRCSQYIFRTSITYSIYYMLYT